jgi:hypothetical protein
LKEGVNSIEGRKGGREEGRKETEGTALTGGTPFLLVSEEGRKEGRKNIW